MPIQEGIGPGVTRNFVLRRAKVTVDSSAPVQTKCAGLFCDKQNINEVLKIGRGCGCYSMKERIGSVVMVHGLSIVNDDEGIKIDVEFSSLMFDRMFMKCHMPNTMIKKDFDMTNAYFSFVNAINDVMNSHNRNGGFTVIGWYTRGKIHDKSNTEEGFGVENSEIVYHVVQIVPEWSDALAGVMVTDKFDPRV